MTPLHSEIASNVSRAYDAIGRIAHMRAQARAKEIEQLSGGRVTLAADQVEALTGDLKAEMIGNAARDVRASLNFYVTTNETFKA